jgi:hypothetical protein
MNRTSPFQPSQRQFTALIPQVFCERVAGVSRVAPGQVRSRCIGVALAGPAVPGASRGGRTAAVRRMSANCQTVFNN